MIYKIALGKDGKYDGKREVEGTPIVIPGFEKFQFFSHTSDDLFTPKEWRVSEVTTGFLIGHGKTEGDAIENTKEILLKAGKDKLANNIMTTRKFLKSQGVADGN